MYSAGNTEMLAQAPNVLDVGKWHDIKLVVDKKGCAGYVNGNELFNVEHAEWLDGRVGIQAFSGMMDFDDFIVYGPAGAAVEPTGKKSTVWAQVRNDY